MIRAGRGHRKVATTCRSSKPEFPSGAKGLPRIPGARPSNICRAASPLADVQRQYLDYGKGRSLAEEFASAISNAAVFRGVREKLEASTQAAAADKTSSSERGPLSKRFRIVALVAFPAFARCLQREAGG